VLFEGVDLLSLGDSKLNKIRWNKISYIPRGSMNSLNPVLTIEEQATDALLEHSALTKKEAKHVIEEKLGVVGLPKEILRAYPHELSGGYEAEGYHSHSHRIEPDACHC